MEERQSSIDFLRIMSMLGIVGVHVLNNGGVVESLDHVSVTGIIIYIIRAICYTSVDLFAMITGYLYVGKENVKYKRIIDLWGVVIFYTISFTVFFLLIKPEYFPDSNSIIRSIFPPIEGRFWYITCYTLMFLLIPYINRFITSISENEYRRMLLVLYITLCCVTVFGLYDYFRVEYGYSASWLIYCYLLGAYIKKYGFVLTHKAVSDIVIIFVLLCSLLISSFSDIIYIIATPSVRYYLRRNDWLVGYNSPLTVISAILILYIFSKVQKSSTSRLLVAVSNATFGVYIIHGQTIIFDNYLKGTFSYIAFVTPIKAVLYFIVASMSIFICCCLIEIVRHRLLQALEGGITCLIKYKL